MGVSLPEQFNAATYFVDRNVREGRGEDLAVCFRDERLTYADVLAQVNRAGNALLREGVDRGDRVLVLLPDGPAFVAAFWGAIKIGAVPIPTNTLLPGQDYEFMLRDSRARALVVDAAYRERVKPHLAGLADLRTVLVAGEKSPAGKSWDEALEKASTDLSPAPTHRDDPAFWLYTSGSTGRPKAAIHRQRAMVCCFELFARQVLGITARDRTFSASKLFFAYGLGNGLYFPFGTGASTVLLAERPTPEKVFEVIDRHRPTVFFGVPTLYAALLQVPEAEKKYDLSSLRCAVSAGEALPAPLWEKFHARFGLKILDGVGSTEMLHMYISNRPEDIRPGSSGKLIPGYEARLTDEEGRAVPPGEVGNMWIRGGSAAAGYWQRPERTRSTFVDDWVLTGDKYRRDDQGYFYFCGRSDDMLKVGGLWVSPTEIESALLAHPAVVECATVGAEDEDRLVKPKVFLVMKAARPPAGWEKELKEFLRDKLPGYKVPAWFVPVESLPKTATGKIQRFKLRELPAKAAGQES